MRAIRFVPLLLTISLAATAWAQGGGGRGRGNQQANPQQQATPQTQQAPQNQGGNQGRGNQGGAATTEFYNYDPTATGGKAIPDAPPVETQHKITVNGEAIAYTARAGFLALHNATTGQSEAHLFYTSYVKDGLTDPLTRKIVFLLGGSPGVSAAWQELGGLGPKRANLAGGTWSDNPTSILPQADLVFVNPVGTAFSRPDQPSRGTNFWNTAGDIASLGEFIRSYLLRNNRRTSPVFLVGEDFGTGRAAGLAAYLQDHQIPVHGLALFSMTESADSTAGDAQYITVLPSLIMSAWVHKKLAPELSAMSAEQIAGQARQFASREYLHALYNADRMTTAERTKVIADLSRFTGTSKQFVISNNLRISLDRFNAELMRDQQKGLSSSDARVAGFLASSGGGRGGGPPAVDFNMSMISGDFLTAYESYLQRELTFNAADEIYYLSTGGVNGFTSTGTDDATLQAAFTRNPNLRLFVAVNYFDLNAPFYATEFTLAHLTVSPEVRAHNIVIKNYEAGQMTYLDGKESVKLQRDLAAFLSESGKK
jgi:carboxypeptidase C (cathepsin A)